MDVNVRLYELNGQTMGTHYHVAFTTNNSIDYDLIAANVYSAVNQVDCEMSTWKADSALSLFNRTAPGKWFDAPYDLATVIRQGLIISHATNGAFDMTVGELVNRWGFGPEGIQNTSTNRNEPNCVIETNGYTQLEVRFDPPGLKKFAACYLDLSGIAKGFGVDQIAYVLEDAEIFDYIVEIDGETRVRGHKRINEPWMVAIEAPIVGVREIWDIMAPSDCAIATSGNYRRILEFEGKNTSHTIDPRSRQPVENTIGSVTVCHSHCMLADAWATALLVLGLDKGIELAQQHKIPALFLVHTDQGINDITTCDFESVIG